MQFYENNLLMKTYYRAAALLLALAVAAGGAETSAQHRSRHAEAVQEQPRKSFAGQVSDDHMSFYANGGVFEKLYLMTDKPYYSAGETMYFSGFLVHATFLTRFSATEFIYVELISPEGRLVERVKVCADRRQFIGTFSLSPRLTAGRYTLRAYSRWQTNFDMGYFYTRQIEIGNTIDDAILTSTTYRVNDNGTVSAFVRMVNQDYMPLTAMPVRYRTVVDNRSRGGSGKTDDKGVVEIRFRPSESPNDCIELNVRANSRELSRFIQLPSFSQDYDLTFCPEGGNLVGGLLQVVAFKALAANGRSVEVSGKIYDDRGTFITDIETEHKGMGRFLMVADPARRYYAETISAAGLTKRFELPAAAAAGVVLRVSRTASGHTFIVQPAGGIDLGEYAAVIHSRGALMSIIEDLSRPARILDKDMFDGIAQVSIVHKVSMRIVAERLFYVRDGRFAVAEITADKAGYGRRERVNLTIGVKDSEGRPAEGNFALTVTDSSYVELDEGAPNIMSYLLLSSDLQGEVEEPGYYFGTGSKVDERLDLVMLTNGWRRYSLASVLAHEYPRIMYPVEDSQRICGSVFGLLGRARKPSIVVMDSNTKRVDFFELNEANNFIISGLDAFSTTTYIVQALNKKGKDTTVRIKIESENYPVPVSDYRRQYWEDVRESIPESFLNRAKERYYTDGGERIIDIEEIVITARRRTTPFFATGNTGSMLNGDLSRFATVYDALATFKELDVTGTSVKTLPKYVQRDIVDNSAVAEFGGGDFNTNSEEGEEDVTFTREVHTGDLNMEQPDLYINGNLADLNAIDAYETKYIERLAFVDGRGAYMLGLSAPAGAIMMEVSKEGLSTAVTTDAMARVVVKAVQKPEEFYKPKYETPAQRADGKTDMRSTIAWEPLIRPDSAGHAEIWFYTADRTGRYDILLEGITDDGEICRTVAEIEVK